MFKHIKYNEVKVGDELILGHYQDYHVRLFQFVVNKMRTDIKDCVLVTWVPNETMPMMPFITLDKFDDIILVGENNVID